MSNALPLPGSAAAGGPGNALAALRAATATRHQQVDRQMPLSQPLPTVAQYRRHLQLIRAWLAPIEPWLAGFRDGLQDPQRLPPLGRLALIDGDLHDSGPPHAPDGDARPPAHRQAEGHRGAAASLPAPRAVAQAGVGFRSGVAYVIEGSQLGGLVLHQRLSARLAPHRPRYLDGDRGAVSQRWRQVTGLLQDTLVDQAAIAQACAGACAAFDDLLEILSAEGG